MDRSTRALCPPKRLHKNKKRTSRLSRSPRSLSRPWVALVDGECRAARSHESSHTGSKFLKRPQSARRFTSPPPPFLPHLRLRATIPQAPRGRPTVRVKGSTHPLSLSTEPSIPRPNRGRRAAKE